MDNVKQNGSNKESFDSNIAVTDLCPAVSLVVCWMYSFKCVYNYGNVCVIKREKHCTR